MTTAAMEAVLRWLPHAGWQAALLGALVLLVSRALGGRLEARWRFALWWVVLARLALPVAPAAPWSLFQLAQLLDGGTGVSPVRVIQTGEMPVPPERVFVVPVVAHPIEPDAPAVEESPAVAPDEPPASPITPTTWLALGWLLGVAALLARQLVALRRLRRQSRSWREPADPALRELFDGCRAELRITRPVRLRVAPGRFGPATCGAVRSCVVLPADLLARLTPDEVRLVLLHELIHVRRRDVPLDRLATLLTAVHWFNPIAWVARACLRRDRELACDEAVLAHLGGREPGRYGHALLRIAQQLAAPTSPATVGIFGRHHHLTRRIQMIARYRKPTAARRALGVLLVVIVAALGLTDGTATPPAGGDAGGAKAGRGPATLAGVAQDETGKPLAGVRVRLYREDYQELSAERLQAATTDAAGRFAFRDLTPPPDNVSRLDWGYTLVATKPGRGSVLYSLLGQPIDKPLQLKLGPAATLKGRVTDANGRPVAGARVWCRALVNGPVDGVCSTRTDADGRYTITDMTAWEPKPMPAGNGRMDMVTGCVFDVQHPGYGHERPMYRRMPDAVNVVLHLAGVIEGRVVDTVSGKPAAGVVVVIQGTNQSRPEYSEEVRTGADGKYRFASLLAGKYNLWADAPDRACAALDSFAVESGKTRAAPDLSLIEGGWLEGQVTDARTGKAIVNDTRGERLLVGLYGPSRPKSGAACQASRVDEHGRFRLRVAPGINYPYVMDGEYWTRTQRREFFEKGLDVRAGEVVSVVFRVLPAKPLPDPEPDPVRLPVPVPAEREAAARVRQLGGWYAVDADRHVVEVNMVYHQSGKQRYANSQTDTDAALRFAGAFPRLQRLLLQKGQATDDGLRAVAGLKGLETLMVWDADHVTDAGVRHLSGLPKLRRVHFSNGKLGDDSLAVFGQLPAVRQLILQGNSFTDAGLKHLAGATRLRSLWVGMNRKPITDAGVRHLAGLTRLEELDLQGSHLSDAGIAALANLKQLRTLYVVDAAPGGGAITDASVACLVGFTRLEHLGLQNTRVTEDGVRRLLELKGLKDLTVSSSALSEAARQRLQKQRPGLQLHVSGSPRAE
jgi:beta-lactamase regulating signal transducer with metallopeptidase domain/5-hydroxyisourate hydrolase-like protein (transthyretin family)